MKYVSAQKMRAIDRIAQEKFRIPALMLMENAGLLAALQIINLAGNNNLKKIAVFCGKGNNGGDGFVVARQLHVRGVRVRVFLLCEEGEVRNREARINLDILKKLGVKITCVPDIQAAKKAVGGFSFNAAIDAIFGTGFSGTLPEYISYVVDRINATGRPVYSLDAPTGLDATSGKVRGACVKARATITFGFPKTGFTRLSGPKFCGRVITLNIGYPPQLI